MQQKNLYQKPLARIVLVQQHQLVLASAGAQPSATWMEDPDIGDEE